MLLECRVGACLKAIVFQLKIAGFHGKFIPVYLSKFLLCKSTGKRVAGLFFRSCIVTARMYQPCCAVYITLGVIVKPWSAAIFVLLVCSTAKAQPGGNLAYDDGFVWYLSGRLASELTAFQARSGIKLSEGEWAEQRQQLEIVYHHYLVRCDGPLPKIAGTLKFADMSTPSKLPGTQLLGYVGSMDSEIWPQIQIWQAKVLTELIATYQAGRYGFFPDCVVSGYRDQNPESSQK